LSCATTDLFVSGRGPDLAFARTFNSLAAGTNSPIGYGWTHDYNTYIDNPINPNVYQENGSVAPFTGSGSPGSDYSHDARLLAELHRNLDGTYVFTHTQALARYLYDPQGRLTSIADRNGYTTTRLDPVALLRGVTHSA